jgi:hypothetical protein
MLLPVGGSPVILNLQHHGDLVTRGFFAVATGGAPTTIYVSESILTQE